ncbi:MAG: ATP-binding protein [Bacteroidales bacterium]|jgi:nitrogen fixation/metabolism regulation signal transduction histidine kinase|nr:ATP-binding protein [Bacteroidales bacterium]
MVYKKYYLQIIIRTALILLNCLVFSYTALKYDYLYTIAFLGFLIVFQVVLLIRYINQSNIFLERFLVYIKEKNTTIDFSESLENTPFRDLKYYFNEINKIIKNAQIAKENQYLFLQYIFDHVTIGLIAFKKNYTVDLINTAAKQILNIQSLARLDNLKKINPSLFKTITSLKPGEQKILPLQVASKNLQLSIKLSYFKLLNEETWLLSLQDIKPELDHQEIESWQKLNRVLTHEIMNSVSPIIALTNNVSRLLKKKHGIKNIREITEENIEQTVQSLNIIEERSLGLNNFIKKFRSITTRINPEPESINVLEFFEDLTIFLYESFRKNGIQFNHSVESADFSIFADRKLLEQVIINLLKNSMEAFSKQENKTIQLRARRNDRNQPIIEVIDNGDGIPKEQMDMIFTPFFTSKDSGSGIGLSLSKNILKQQGYNIDVRSVPNTETVFTLYF